jgi:flagellar protein FliS
MTHTTDETYLATEVLTAPPQKRHLMLVAAALRHARAAQAARRQHRHEPAAESLLRAQEIVGELLAGLRTDQAPEITRKVAAVYVFIYRSLVTAHLRQSDSDLESAIAVLQEELLTWQAVCAQLPADPAAASPAALPGETPSAAAPTASAVASPHHALRGPSSPHEQASGSRWSGHHPSGPHGPSAAARADLRTPQSVDLPHAIDSPGINFQA